MGRGVQVARGEGLVEVLSLQIGAHLLEQGLALDVGVLGGSIAGLVCQGGTGLGALGACMTSSTSKFCSTSSFWRASR